MYRLHAAIRPDCIRLARTRHQAIRIIIKTVWGGSSAGRALRSQRRGREFDPHSLHQTFWLYQMLTKNRKLP